VRGSPRSNASAGPTGVRKGCSKGVLDHKTPLNQGHNVKNTELVTEVDAERHDGDEARTITVGGDFWLGPHAPRQGYADHLYMRVPARRGRDIGWRLLA
jgi:hypothetical protein